MRRLASVVVPLTSLLACGCGGRTGLDLSGAFPDTGPFDGSSIPDTASPIEAGSACDDGGPPEISYLLDSSGTLYRYDTQTQFTLPLGIPNCGDDNVQWTMTASRENAYIVYTDWTLYAVSLSTLACSPTPFPASPIDIGSEFGVAVADIGGVEKLYVYAEDSEGNGPFLAVTDLASFQLTKIGDVLPPPPADTFPVNLTADTMGHLYAFSPGGFVQKIDATTGSVLHSVQTNVTTSGTWASLTYGPELFLFVDSDVDGYDLMTQMQTSSFDAGIAPVGGNSVAACPGQ
jgi:hypothetical protein